MRFLFFVHAFEPMESGAEVAAKNLAAALAGRGHEVHVVTRSVPGCAGEESRYGIRLHRIWPPIQSLRQITDNRLGWGSAAYAWNAWLAGRRITETLQPDVIHGHQLMAGLAACGIAAASRKPFVFTLQKGIGADDYLPGSGRRGSLLAFLIPLLRFVLRQADAVHVPSLASKAAAEALGAKRVEVIPNAIDEKNFAGRARGDGSTLISISRFTEKNGLEYLIQAMPLVLRKVPNARLKLVGYGTMEKRLRELAVDLGVGDKTEFVGPVANERVPELLRQADVFVRPSLEEGFGVGFVEAMAARLPVIGSNVGGIPDIVQDGWNGLLVEPRDKVGLALAIERLLVDESLRERLAENGLKTVQKKYARERVLERFEALYGSVVGAKK